MVFAQPSIEVELGAHGVRINQRRSDVTRALGGRPVAEALDLLPRLLPVCGAAQRIAAERAVAACRGEEEDDALRATRRGMLLREQAMAFAWRCAVDLPVRLGEVPAPSCVLGVRDAANSEERAAALEALVGGLATLAPDAEPTGEALEEPWARWLAGLDVGAPRVPIDRLGGAALIDRVRPLLAARAFDPLAPALEAPCEIGPLVRHAQALCERFPDAGPLRHRALALIVDGHRIADDLRSRAVEEGAAEASWLELSGAGVGQAMTARGPVFHRVELDERERVLDWRVLAPTDLHFAPGGAVAATCAALDRDQEACGLAVATFDACAPVEIVMEAAAPAH